MINRIECSRDEDDGKLTIRMFEESSGLVGVAKTAPFAAKHIFDTYGGPCLDDSWRLVRPNHTTTFGQKFAIYCKKSVDKVAFICYNVIFIEGFIMYSLIKNANTNMTSFQGRLKARYSDLVEIFGEPTYDTPSWRQ